MFESQKSLTKFGGRPMRRSFSLATYSSNYMGMGKEQLSQYHHISSTNIDLTYFAMYCYVCFENPLSNYTSICYCNGTVNIRSGHCTLDNDNGSSAVVKLRCTNAARKLSAV